MSQIHGSVGHHRSALPKVCNLPTISYQRTWRHLLFIVIAAACLIHFPPDSTLADVATPYQSQKRSSDDSIQLSVTNTPTTIRGSISSFNLHSAIEFHTLDVYVGNLFDHVYEDTQRLGTFEGTKAEFLDTIGLSFQDLETTIGFGWSMDVTNGVAHWSHVSGEPIVDYDPFLSTQGYPAVTEFVIPAQYADWNGDGVFSVKEGDGLRIVDVEEYVLHVGSDGIYEYPSYAAFALGARPAIPQPHVAISGTFYTNILVNAMGEGFTHSTTDGFLTYTVMPASFDAEHYVVDFELLNIFSNSSVRIYDLFLTQLLTELGATQDDIDRSFSLEITDDFTAGHDVVNVGWVGMFQDQQVRLTHIDGAPGASYDVWEPLGSEPSTMLLRLQIDRDEFDNNGDGWSQDDVIDGIDSFVSQYSNDRLLVRAYDTPGTSIRIVSGLPLNVRQLVATPVFEISGSNLVPGVNYRVQFTRSLVEPLSWYRSRVWYFVATNNQQLITVYTRSSMYNYVRISEQ